jgi:hypothetical protein
MPRLRRHAARPALAQPDVLWTYVLGIGDLDDPLVRRAWPRSRLEAWRETARHHHFPLAANKYDGLTNTAFCELELPDICRNGRGEATPIYIDGQPTWCEKPPGCPHVFNHARFREALAADRAALAAFRERNPKAAKTLAPYLAIFQADLGAAETAARLRAAGLPWREPDANCGGETEIDGEEQ